MATYQQQRKTTVDPQSGMPLTSDVDPAAPTVNISQRTAASPDSSMTGIIIAVVVVLIGAILAFNYGWFGGTDAPNVTQNNTTQTAPETTSPTIIEPAPSGTSSTTTTTTEPAGSGTTGTGTADQ